VVAVFWGFTNPLIKRGSAGLENVKAGRMGQTVAEVVFLFTRWQYVLPLAINLSGSVAYYHTLGKADLTLAVPVANALTFVCTTLAGWMLGEERPSRNTWLGISLVILGISLCVADHTSI
jgi:drug/metabolite transporter (DMT)-like permease